MVLAVTEKNQDTNDVFNVGMNITKFPNEGKTLAEITEINLEMIKEHRPHYKVGVKNFTNQNGVEMVILKVEFTEREIDLSGFSIFFINGPNFFNMTQTAEAKEIDDYRWAFDRLINSVEWIEK